MGILRVLRIQVGDRQLLSQWTRVQTATMTAVQLSLGRYVSLLTVCLLHGRHRPPPYTPHSPTLKSMYTISNAKGEGKGLFATCDIPRGSLIHTEEPVVFVREMRDFHTLVWSLTDCALRSEKSLKDMSECPIPVWDLNDKKEVKKLSKLHNGFSKHDIVSQGRIQDEG